jgi:signal transduction histidine kinase
MREVIRASEERHLSLANDVLNIPRLGIFVLDSDFMVIWMNSTLERYFGFGRDGVVGEDMRRLVCDRIKEVFEESEAFVEKMLAAYDNNSCIESLGCHVLPEGDREERWLEHWSQPIRSGPAKGGRVEYYLDITEHKLAEDALRASRKRLETIFDAIAGSLYAVDRTVDQRSLIPKLIDQIQNLTAIETPTSGSEEAQEIDAQLTTHLEHLKELVEERLAELMEAERMAALGEAAAMIAHDLRNPLQDIQLARDLLGKRCPQERKLVDQIDRNVGYADGIVENLLIYSRKRPLALEETDINQLLRKSIKESALPKNIKAEEKLGELPRVNVDPTLMKRVFQNLNQNAAQAMEDGGTLTVASRHMDESLVITFQDTGVGIPETKQELIWRPFYTTKAKGMGLGLSIAKQIVESHSGTINAKSTLNEGTIFTIQLPVQAHGKTTLDSKGK